MKRITRIRRYVALALLLSLLGSQAMSMGYPHQLFSGKRSLKKHAHETRTSKKAPMKVESLSRSAWVLGPSETDEEADSSVSQSLVRFVSDWLGNLLRPRTVRIAGAVGMPVELLKQTKPEPGKAALRVPNRLSVCQNTLIS
jgi:hypothetical protein